MSGLDGLADIRRWADMVAALPPRPRCIMAHHSVPYGKVFRQWNTRGELIVWVNRGEIADMARRPAWDYATNAMLFSLPVVNSE